MKDLVYFLLLIFTPRRKGVPILVYHSVNSDHKLLNVVDTKIFDKQMCYLKKKNYRVISLKRLVELIRKSKDLPPKTVVLTFDDGFRDNYFNVWPILKKYQFPATVFISSGLVGKKMKLQNTFLDLLNWSDIKKMNKSELIDFQLHGFNHHKMNEIGLAQAKEEISRSKNMIEKKLNKLCLFFAYPHGKYNQNVVKLLKEQGVKAALTIKTGLTGKGDDLFELKRIPINSAISFIRFKAKLLGLVFVRK